MSSIPLAQDMPQIAGINVAETVANIGGELDFFRELLEILVVSNAGVMKDIEALITAGDADRAAMRAHKLRGEAGNLGAWRVQAAAGSLEEVLRAGASSEVIAGKLAALNEACTDMFEAARQWLAQSAT